MPRPPAGYPADGPFDALADAFATALEWWPRDGVPANPQAWLTTVAKRRLLEAARRARRAIGLTEDPRIRAYLAATAADAT